MVDSLVKASSRRSKWLIEADSLLAAASGACSNVIRVFAAALTRSCSWLGDGESKDRFSNDDRTVDCARRPK